MVQRDLADVELDLNIPLGCSAWIALGLKLEEQQYRFFLSTHIYHVLHLP